MASPFLLQNAFEGIWQDSPRDMLPAGKLWNMVDLIPSFIGAPARRRGGWTSASAQLGSCTGVQGLLYADTFGTDGVNFAIGSDNHLYSFTVIATSDIGTAVAVSQNPIIHRTGSTPLVVIPAAGGSTAPKSYDGTTLQNLAGSPPDGIYADVWNDRTLLANSTAQPQRLWFGPVGDAAGTWDTTNSWIDLRTDVVGIAAIRTGILAFHKRSTDIITGTTPPEATTIGDLTVRAPVFDVGCVDAQSIVKYNDTVLWADARGVYQTDGNTIKDLTSSGGIKYLWAQMLNPSNPASFYPASDVLPDPALFPIAGMSSGFGETRVAAGVFHDTYVVTISGVTSAYRAEIVTFAYDLLRGFWYKLSNFRASCYARQGDTVEETYMGLFQSQASNNGGYVAALSKTLLTAPGAATDDDGVAIQPLYETALYRGWAHFHRKWVASMGLQVWRRMYLNYLLTDSSSTNPFLTISYATDVNQQSYIALSPLLPEDSVYKRVHRDLRFQASGIMFKVQQTNASSDTQLHAIEIEYAPLEGSRLAQ